MNVHAHWFLPTSGDSRNLDAAAVSAKETPHLQPAAQRPPSIEYLAQIAGAAEHLGYEAVLTPTGTWCEDAWLTTAALLRETTRLRFLVALRPGFLSPTLAAQMAATYQHISGGRLLLNVVTGGDADEQQRFGDWLNHDARYRRTEEFLQIVQGAWTGRPFTFDGEHYAVRGATVRERPDPTPPIFFGGASPAAELVAARQSDVYLLWGEPPAAVAERLDRMRPLAKEQDRELKFGIRLHVITRDTAAAWAIADELLAQLDPAAIAAAQRRFAQTESVGQQRMAALHHGNSDLPESLGGLRPRPRRRRHRARRQPLRGRGPHRGVPRPRHRAHHPLRPAAPGGGVLVRRGSPVPAAPPGPARARPGADRRDQGLTARPARPGGHAGGDENRDDRGDRRGHRGVHPQVL